MINCLESSSYDKRDDNHRHLFNNNLYYLMSIYLSNKLPKTILHLTSEPVKRISEYTILILLIY